MILCIYLHIDGHKIAKKISKQITQQTKKVNVVLGHYNAAAVVLGCSPISFSTVTSPDASFWKSSFGDCSKAGISSDVQNDLIHNYLLFERSSEELGLLKQDIDNTLKYYNFERKILLESLQQLECQLSSAYLNGCAALLKQRLLQVNNLIDKATDTISMMNGPAICTYDNRSRAEAYDSDSDDSLFSDDDDDDVDFV